MRLVIQRVTQASVTVSGSVVGAINKGYLVLVGIGQNDTEAIVEKMADKNEEEKSCMRRPMKTIKSTCPCKTLAVNCCWFRNSHYMQTAERATAPALSLPEHPKPQRLCMNT